MAMLLKRLSRLEAQMDNAIEKFLFHHHVWGFLMIFIGIPLITLTAVCLFTAAIVFPLGVFVPDYRRLFRLDLTGAAPSFQSAPKRQSPHLNIILIYASNR